MWWIIGSAVPEFRQFFDDFPALLGVMPASTTQIQGTELAFHLFHFLIKKTMMAILPHPTDLTCS